MILKGSQRGGGRALALHLMNAQDNDHITIHQLRGILGDDLAGAFAEIEAVSYAEEYAPTVGAPERLGYAIDALLPFWDGAKLSQVKVETCRRYARTRAKVLERDPKTGDPKVTAPISDGTVRRELNVLQAAINYSHREGRITTAPVVTLPPKPETGNRWLTCEEAAKLVSAACLSKNSSHIAKFILIGLYTGMRKKAILGMGLQPNPLGGCFDLENGVMYKKSEAERTTKKAPDSIPHSTPTAVTSQALAGERSSLGCRIQKRCCHGHQARVSNRGRSCRDRQVHTPHPKTHGDYLGDAEWRRDVGCGRLLFHQPGDHRIGVWAPSSDAPGIGPKSGRKTLNLLRVTSIEKCGSP